MEKTPAIQQYEAFEVRYPKVVILMQMGDFLTHEINDEAQIYSFFRNLAHESVLVVLNNSREEQRKAVPKNNAGKYVPAHSVGSK